MLEMIIYDSEVREVGHHTRDCDGKKFIIVNQRYWYDADEHTEETAIASFRAAVAKKRKGWATK